MTLLASSRICGTYVDREQYKYDDNNDNKIRWCARAL